MDTVECRMLRLAGVQVQRRVGGLGPQPACAVPPRCAAATPCLPGTSTMQMGVLPTALLGVMLSLRINALSANPDANRLFEDLLSDYNKLVRPVNNNSETLIVKFKLKLSQLLDVHEKNQIMTTNVWLQHSWTDYKLKWDPSEYGGVDVLYVPSEMIWLPDIVLYNNADGNYQVTIMTKAKLLHNGTVEWTPPAIYKSMCQIDVEWFPFDSQKCNMKFGSWTYGGLEVDLKHKDEHNQSVKWVPDTSQPGAPDEKVWEVERGIDLDDYYSSVEWDILAVPARRHEKSYPCCESPFIDITYELRLRRKTLFYTVNLIFPSVGISFLTALVFYLPSDSGEKISLCISILISLTVFFLLLVEIIPSTSLVIPLIGKYLLFTMVLVTLSVVVTVITLNVHYRSPTTHTMPVWFKRVFIDILPKYLAMRRPTANEQQQEMYEATMEASKRGEASAARLLSVVRPPSVLDVPSMAGGSTPKRRLSTIDPIGRRVSAGNAFTSFLSPSAFEMGGLTEETTTPGDGHTGAAADPLFGVTTGGTLMGAAGRLAQATPLRMAVESVCYIADHLRSGEEDSAVIEDWKFVAMVMDRLFLWAFTLSCAAGTIVIILRAPSIRDTSVPIA